MTAFDTVHAAIAETRGRPITGSGGDYDLVDVDRIPLGDDGET